MTYINASYQTGLQLLMAGAASNSGSGTSASSETTTSVDAGTTTTGAPSQNSSTSSNTSDGYSSASAIAALKAVASTTSGPAAGVMAAIVAALSTKNDFYGNYAAAEDASAQADSQLSSQQLSETLLSGGSIVTGLNASGSGFQTESMADILKNIQQLISGAQSADKYMSQWLQSGKPSSDPTYGQSSFENMTPGQIGQIIASNEQNTAQMQNQYNYMTSALAGGTLTIQNATDVSGLEYKNTTDKHTENPGGNGITDTRVQNGGDNPAYLQKNENNGFLFNIGGMGIYFSW